MSASADAKQTIEDMKFALAVGTDRELAKRLGLDPSAIAAWRRRGSVPLKYQVRFARISDELAHEGPFNPTYHKLLNGYLFALLGLAARKLEKEVILLKEEEFKDMWYGFALHRLYEYLFKVLHRCSSGDKDQLRAEYQRLRLHVDGEDLYAWIESLPDHL